MRLGLIIFGSLNSMTGGSRNGLINRIYRTIETHYLKTVDAFIFNSHTTRKNVEALVDGKRSSIVATPAGDRLGHLPFGDLIESRAKTDGCAGQNSWSVGFSKIHRTANHVMSFPDTRLHGYERDG